MEFVPDNVSPRDWFALQRIVVTQVALAAGIPSLLCSENADRVVLLMLPCGNLAFGAAPYKSTTTNNMCVVPGNQQFILTFDQHGKACQIEWYGLTTSMTATVLVVETILDRTPAEYGQLYRGRRNAPVSARGSPAGRDNGLAVAGAKSVSRWIDNLGASDQSLHDLIRRRGRSP